MIFQNMRSKGKNYERALENKKCGNHCCGPAVWWKTWFLISPPNDQPLFASPSDRELTTLWCRVDASPGFNAFCSFPLPSGVWVDVISHISRPGCAHQKIPLILIPLAQSSRLPHFSWLDDSRLTLKSHNGRHSTKQTRSLGHPFPADPLHQKQEAWDEKYSFSSVKTLRFWGCL